MLRSSARLGSLLVLLPLTACTGLGTGPDGLAARQALLEINARGTPVSAFVAIDPVACAESGSEFRLSGELTAPEALRFVELVVEIDGVEHARHPLAQAKSFEKRDDLKVARIDQSVPVPSGQHVVRMCLSQTGEKKPAQTGACVPAFEYVSDCEEVPAVDTTLPTIVAERDRAPNENGWYNAPMSVSFVCDDTESGVASCSPPVALTSEGSDLIARGQAKDASGNTAGRAEGPIRIDMTPPAISFPGAREYLVDEVIEVSCAVGDALSGVKETQCTAHAGDAFWVPLGSHMVTATATDLAGNSAVARAEFSVTVTSDSLCHLVERFATKSGIANSLCAKLKAADASTSKGKGNSLNGQLDAFQHEVLAQSGKAISAAHAAILIAMADGLRVE